MDAFLEKSKGRDVLISGEGIIRLTQAQLITFQHYLSKYFDKIVVVAYVRPPCGYIQSAFQQVSKHKAKSFDPDNSYPNYRETFQKFLDVFSPENVKFWLFKPESFPGKCVVRDFTKRFDNEIPSDKVVKVNEGLSKEAIILIQVYWHHVAPTIHDKEQAEAIGQKILQLLKEVKGSKFSVSSDVLIKIKNQHLEDILWMERMLGEKLDEDLTVVTDNDISCDEDLTDVSMNSIELLLEVLGRKINKKLPVIDQKKPIDQAITILEFVAKHFSSRQTRRDHRSLQKTKNRMGFKDIADRIHLENPKMKSNPSPETIRSLFEVILSEINTEPAGNVNIQGFGRFVIKNDGNTDNKNSRIIFTPNTRLSKIRS